MDFTNFGLTESGNIALDNGVFQVTDNLIDSTKSHLAFQTTHPKGSYITDPDSGVELETLFLKQNNWEIKVRKILLEKIRKVPYAYPNVALNFQKDKINIEISVYSKTTVSGFQSGNVQLGWG